MKRISPRQLVRGAGAAAATMLDAPSVAAQTGGETLRFVAQADLKIVDPIWTTAYITRNHGYLVYDALFGTDEQFRVKPQMVGRTTVSPDGMKYTFTLRDGLRWHDAQPVVSARAWATRSTSVTGWWGGQSSSGESARSTLVLSFVIVAMR